MKILVVGCGNVGYTIAETLNREKHSITIIDIDEEKASTMATRLDVVSVAGNGAAYSVLKEGGVKDCDVLIATTGQDEINMLCCLIAKNEGRCRTIARVRNPEYYNEIGSVQKFLGIDLVINPEFSAAESCYQLLWAPGASYVDSFAQGKVLVVTVRLPEKSPWVRKSLNEINRGCRAQFLIAVVERKGESFVPNGYSVIHEGDQLSLLVDKADLNLVLRNMGLVFKPIKSVLIGGCGTMGYYLTKRLLKERVNVKIVEPNLSRCNKLWDELPGATVLNGSFNNELFLQEAGISNVDAVVALSGNDSDNIVLSLYANKVTNAKLITRVNKMTMGGVLSEIPIGAIVSPKALTAEYILRYARASSSDESDSSMEAMHFLADGKIEALSFTVYRDSPLVGVQFKSLRLRKGVLFGAIIRGESVIIPSGADAIRPWDLVVVLTEHKGTRKIRDVLA
ncbi:MAG: Trk system potassium transporter TrkA [Clostridiales bacterium]|nr:Trk system potassium transporter TrkA [Clostridiales bacterium]